MTELKCSWVIILYHCYLGVRWDVNLSDLVRAAQRAEFKAGHLEAKLAAGPAEEHQPVTTCILLLPTPLSPQLTPSPAALLWKKKPHRILISAQSISSAHHSSWTPCGGSAVASAVGAAVMLSGRRNISCRCKVLKGVHREIRIGFELYVLKQFWTK